MNGVPKNPGGYSHKLTSKYYCCWRWHVYNRRHNSTGCANIKLWQEPTV